MVSFIATLYIFFSFFDQFNDFNGDLFVSNSIIMIYTKLRIFNISTIASVSNLQ